MIHIIYRIVNSQDLIVSDPLCTETNPFTYTESEKTSFPLSVKYTINLIRTLKKKFPFNHKVV